jgi:hypothetical protein
LENFLSQAPTERPREGISQADADALRALGYLDDGGAIYVPEE